MSYEELAEHPLTYASVGVGVLFVLGFALIVLLRALRHARRLGYTNERLWRVAQVSVSSALLPAIAVLLGFLLLAPMLGIPLSWWRLSIVGNTAYEIMAANMALNTAGAMGTAREAASGSDFILVMYVMTIGIMGGIVLAPLLAKRIHRGALKTREKDWRWSALSGSTYVATILIVFTVPLIFSFSDTLITFVLAALFMALCRWLTKRFNLEWLNGFAFTISAFAAIVLSVLYERLSG
ncbi:MAG: DUF5058 family protein [Coriobacteriales bacterium]|jgi:hypothetical protein|nr:DUF5058 family protein [Coriobacteriales bacterium]